MLIVGEFHHYILKSYLIVTNILEITHKLEYYWIKVIVLHRSYYMAIEIMGDYAKVVVTANTNRKLLSFLLKLSLGN